MLCSLAGYKPLWFCLGWSLCTPKLERLTIPPAAFPWSVRLLSMLSSLGGSMYFSYFSFILIFKANWSWTIQLSVFSALSGCCDVHSCCPVSSTLLSACHQQQSMQGAGVLLTPLMEGNCPARAGKGILGTVGSSLTKHDRQESQSSAKINPSSAYDWGLARPTADTAAQWETNFQITSCPEVSLSGMFWVFSLPLWWVFLVVLGVLFSAKEFNACPAHRHHSYAEIQTYIVCEPVVQQAFNFGTA